MSNEAELVAAALAGEEDAFTALYQSHARYVRAVGRSFLRTEELEDLCQDTFLLAFTRLHTFAGRSSFRTWITRIAINQCLLVLRQRSRGTDVPLEEEDVLFTTRDVYLDGVAARVDTERLLRRLRPMTRTVLEMACLEEFSDGEIAASMGVSLSTVKRILARAKQSLRSLDNNR